MDRHLRPNLDALAVLASGAEAQLARARDRGGVECRLSARLEHLDGVDGPRVRDANLEQRLALDVLIPQLERIFDRDLTVERRGLVDRLISGAPEAQRRQDAEPREGGAPDHEASSEEARGSMSSGSAARAPRASARSAEIRFSASRGVSR